MSRMLDLIVAVAGALLIAGGAAWIFPPAGPVVLGVLMVASAWPESKGGDGA